MGTLELIHPPWPANVSGLSLHHFQWENVGRQLPRANSQLPSGVYYFGGGMEMENVVGTGGVRWPWMPGGTGESSRQASCSAADGGVSARGKGVAGLERALLQGWRRVPG